MKLIKARNRLEISDKVQEANSSIERLLGLINPKNSRFLVFNTRLGIHTFFLHQAIDVIVLDDKDFIRIVKSKLKPFHFFFYSPVFSKVIELPEGTVAKLELRVGDKILFE